MQEQMGRPLSDRIPVGRAAVAAAATSGKRLQPNRKTDRPHDHQATGSGTGYARPAGSVRVLDGSGMVANPIGAQINVRSLAIMAACVRLRAPSLRHNVLT